MYSCSYNCTYCTYVPHRHDTVLTPRSRSRTYSTVRYCTGTWYYHRCCTSARWSGRSRRDEYESHESLGESPTGVGHSSHTTTENSQHTRGQGQRQARARRSAQPAQDGVRCWNMTGSKFVRSTEPIIYDGIACGVSGRTRLDSRDLRIS